MCTFVPILISPSYCFTFPSNILKSVLLPTPFAPIMATFSPLFISKFTPSKSGELSNDFFNPSTFNTSFPLKILGVKCNLIFVGRFSGLSNFSIRCNAFSLLSALLIDFSLLNALNVLITSC